MLEVFGFVHHHKSLPWIAILVIEERVLQRRIGSREKVFGEEDLMTKADADRAFDRGHKAKLRILTQVGKGLFERTSESGQDSAKAKADWFGAVGSGIVRAVKCSISHGCLGD